MDFARKQLEKYGWTDGKGLGKHENGISEALKPKLKRSVTGVGHDAAAEFTEHWWTKLYNSAASNVEVKEKNGKTKKIKTKDDEFEITNSSWSYKKKNKSKSKEEYTNFFVKTSILTSGGVKTEDFEREEEIKEESDEVKLTDEQLFAACEGRTAHKGARHGLKALGKLARIEMQEQALLQQSKYNGYSQAKCKEKNTDKKGKNKHSLNELECATDNINENEDKNMEEKTDADNNSEYNIDSTEVSKTKKKKKTKRKQSCGDEDMPVEHTEVEVPKKKKKKIKQDEDSL